jgi:hypothetical protein
MATIFNFEGELPVGASGLAPSDQILVHEASSSVKKSLTGAQVKSQVAVAGGSTLSLTAALHGGKTILLDTATGSVITLPQATGTGNVYRFRVSVLATAASHIVKVANATDVMVGLAFGSRIDSGNAVLGFAAGATDDTITLNRTTTGSVSKGEMIEVVDRATGIFDVKAFLTATGAAFATPFSATV